MGTVFVHLYDLISRHRGIALLCFSLATLVMAYFVAQLAYKEDITTFFPEQEHDAAMIIDNMAGKDRIALMFTYTDSVATTASTPPPSSANEAIDPIDALIDRADAFAQAIVQSPTFTPNATLAMQIDEGRIDAISSYIYHNLPLLIDDEAYTRLEVLTTDSALEARVASCYQTLTSPIGGYAADYLLSDPLGIASPMMLQLSTLGNGYDYQLIDGYLFSPDTKTLLGYVDLKPQADVDAVIDLIEAQLETHSDTTVTGCYFGAPAVAAYNARQIKFDSMVTVNLAIAIIVLLITVAFRSKRSALLLLCPALFGILFALTIIYFVQGEISLIAVGSGSITFGIALSYSIHLIAHTHHNHDIRRVIRELTMPLTIGGFTTIGAFASLIFTDSRLLQDFGLFSSLTLVGATLFTLVALPHMLSNKHRAKAPTFRLIEQIANYDYHKNRLLVGGLLIAICVALCLFGNVGFDSNMMNLNYEPPHLARAEAKLRQFMGNNDRQVLFIASGNDHAEAIAAYHDLSATLDTLRQRGWIDASSDISHLAIDEATQRRRLARWASFWDDARRQRVTTTLEHYALAQGFEAGSFAPFTEMLEHRYTPQPLTVLAALFPEMIAQGDELTTLAARVEIQSAMKERVYQHLAPNRHVIAADKAYFANMMAASVRDNFYFILYISGILIFVALLLSYGRFELALMSFAPMFFSWIIILGIMAAFGIEFNIVTIILSTFIFGIGDDYSIFVMDGLLSRYKDRSEVYRSHKTAIFFSAIALLVGMGALIFSRHPAMHSLGLISLIGMSVVVVISYTLQPLLFKALITLHTAKGNLPYTVLSLLNTAYAFGLFVVGCVALQVATLLLCLVPIGRTRRKRIVSTLMHYACRAFLRAMIFERVVRLKPQDETFRRPAVIIANHQSFIDILMALSLAPRAVMVTKEWVWRAPFFGLIVRYLDFYPAANGYGELTEALRPKVEQGYSVIIFPEGTRSEDCQIRRFHKGAFLLAERLGIELLPMLNYGNGLVASKRQPIYIKRGVALTKVLPRIAYDPAVSYQARCKEVAAYMRHEYDLLYEEYNRASNPYFRSTLIKSYTYKGPVLEWYMRIKVSLEGDYDLFDRTLPRQGHIVDLGCGYGAMSYMLMMLSHRRTILGVDYDHEKIATAQHALLHNDHITFEQQDLRTYDVPAADGYIVADVLHYMEDAQQRRLIEQCIKGLRTGGVLIIRDGDSSQQESHRGTEATERWSTRYVKFNKTDGALHFLSRTMIYEIAEAHQMTVEILQTGKRTSNTLYLITQTKR